ncbi:MAG: hypothetical protein WBO76_00520 [Saprospiraceae bacterium]
MRNLKLTLSVFYFILFTFLNYVNAQSLFTSKNKIEDHLNIYSYQHQDNLKVIDNKCKFYKRIKYIGAGIIVSGSLVLITGIARAERADPVFNLFSETELTPDEKHENSLFVAGVGISLLGAACFGVGIPFAIVGKRKSKQYCNPKTNSLSLISTSKSLGLHLSF